MNADLRQAIRSALDMPLLSERKCEAAYRVVIESIREPTEAMSRAGGLETVEPVEGVWMQEIGDYHAANAYRLMVHALLAETVE